MNLLTLQVFLLVAAVCGVAECIGQETVRENSDDAEQVWNLDALSNPPKMQWLDAGSPVRSLTYDAGEYQGHKTSVFAFYATPGTLRGDTTGDENLPVVVLVHGGGGTAFAEWVQLWALRGYAAIAMDLSGRRPDAPTFTDDRKPIAAGRVKRTRLENGGPEQGHPEKFNSAGGTVQDDWPYHAVTNVILAHSLVRSFPEVDEERTAVTGISWGGYTTCIVASVDHRFQAAVPVYGCGFLYDGESVQRPAIDALRPDQRQEWIRRYDPSSHLANCRVPILFVNGTNDKHYPLKSYLRSFQLVPGTKQMRIEVNMNHSHPGGWRPQEIGLFIDSHVRDGVALPILGRPSLESGQASATYTAVVPLKSASLHYTVDTGSLVSRQWKTVGAEFDDQFISADSLPNNVSIWMLSATDQRGAMISTTPVITK